MSAARTEWPPSLERRRGRPAFGELSYGKAGAFSLKYCLTFQVAAPVEVGGREEFLSWEILGIPDDLRQTEGPATRVGFPFFGLALRSIGPQGQPKKWKKIFVFGSVTQGIYKCRTQNANCRMAEGAERGL
ncbi:hypothetical protein SBV1_480063 [Verrucomicrobia bacterium]|nr:hypothetical protein SBV1_480063 [Verrucomicrobiota bacterium]